ncbi:hypothetical protein [Mycoplasma bradburyae]|uniref:hypothetical protein n=1 Tax=Mycoplasma bradburyae TaxID=2963128 RepID=UPI0020CEB6AA|nr:hypothetical protein [Mycoplasma bradburyae]UTS70557.1 hypothetical protein NMG77_02270 [Mycoplasma bradburyae]
MFINFYNGKFDGSQLDQYNDPTWEIEEYENSESNNSKTERIFNPPKNAIVIGSGTLSGSVYNHKTGTTSKGREYVSFYFSVPNQDGELKESSNKKLYRESDKDTANFGFNACVFANSKNKTIFYAMKGLKNGEFIRIDAQIKVKGSNKKESIEVFLEPLKLLNKFENKKNANQESLNKTRENDVSETDD